MTTKCHKIIEKSVKKKRRKLLKKRKEKKNIFGKLVQKTYNKMTIKLAIKHFKLHTKKIKLQIKAGPQVSKSFPLKQLLGGFGIIIRCED